MPFGEIQGARAGGTLERYMRVTVFTRFIVVVLSIVIVCCSNSNFSGTNGKSTPKTTPKPSPKPGSNTTDSIEDPNGILSSEDPGESSCKEGCCPSERIAFVSCKLTKESATQGLTDADLVSAPDLVSLVKGDFSIDSVDCEKMKSGAAALKSYDTIIYFGPAFGGQQPSVNFLPKPIAQRLVEGAKVVLLPSGPSEQGVYPNITYNYLDFSGYLYGLFIEQNIEFPETIGEAKVTATESNKMTDAFDVGRYGNFHVSKLMFPNFAYPVYPNNDSGSSNQEWCSDMSVQSPTYGRSSAFHAFLLDNAARKGLLLVTTLGYGQAGKVDFSEPFLAAQLNQTWNKTGNSATCGLPCTKAFETVVGMGKPVIYLYPTKEQDVVVKLDVDGQILTTYPKYDDKIHGWKVHAKPDGSLTDLRDKREYSYIYWDGQTKNFKPSFDEGFVVKGEDTRAFLQDTLSKMGMTSREYNDMIVYWLPYMEHHKYNVINFARDSYTNIAKLNVEPKPDSILRVFMAFKKIDQPIKVKPQKIEKFARKGFSVVEWGGTEIDGDWKVIH